MFGGGEGAGEPGEHPWLAALKGLPTAMFAVLLYTYCCTYKPVSRCMFIRGMGDTQVNNAFLCGALDYACFI